MLELHPCKQLVDYTKDGHKDMKRYAYE